MTETRFSQAGLIGSAIDPIATLRQLQASGDLDGPQATMLRVLWVRSDHPDTRVESELTHLHDDLVVFRALVALPGGATATGYASETGAPGGSMALAIERAETRAIGRALDILGYVIPAGASVPAGDDTNAPPVIDALRKASLRHPPAETVILPDPGPEPEVDPETGEIAAEDEPLPSEAPAEKTSPVSANPLPNRRPAVVDSSEEPSLEDYTWTHFWRWARGHNLSTKEQVEERIGRPLDNLTPADVRIALRHSGIEL